METSSAGPLSICRWQDVTSTVVGAGRLVEPRGVYAKCGGVWSLQSWRPFLCTTSVLPYICPEVRFYLSPDQSCVPHRFDAMHTCMSPGPLGLIRADETRERGCDELSGLSQAPRATGARRVA